MRYLLSLFLFLNLHSSAQQTPFEASGKTRTATYNETIAFYSLLSKKYPDKIKFFAETEPGAADTFYYALISSGNTSLKPAIVINNAIHAGEPEGVDASMMLAREIITTTTYEAVLKKYNILIIPAYNSSGMKRRGCCSRANQDGPPEYGFRGNARNLDLNRDFIKCDSREAMCFNKVFSKYHPIVLIDNHTSDGADYQYTLTCITNAPRLPEAMSCYLNDKLLPAINKRTTKDGFELAPYVETLKHTPDSALWQMPTLPAFLRIMPGCTMRIPLPWKHIC